MSNVFISTTKLSFKVAGRTITNLAGTGTVFSIAPGQDRGVHTQGLFKTSVTQVNDTNNYSITVNIQPHSDDHRFMQAAMKASIASGAPLGVDVEYASIKYASGTAMILTEPTVEVAADSTPIVPYVLTGSFPIAVIGVYENPAPLTEADINNFGG
jgi:hypothetical protein